MVIKGSVDNCCHSSFHLFYIRLPQKDKSILIPLPKENKATNAAY